MFIFPKFLALSLLFLASSAMFSCQRNASGAANEEIETSESPVQPSGGNKVNGTPTQADLDAYNPDLYGNIAIDDTTKKADTPKIVYYYNVIQNNDGTFGYEIIEHEKVMISQPTIPGIAGAKGFAERLQAANAGELVVNKILAGQSPTLTESEIQAIIK